jgi:hypothetical protein
LVSGSNPSQPAKLARRIENHPEKYYALDPLRQSSKDGLWVAQREPLGTKLIPALIENSGNAGKGPLAYGSGGPLQPIPPTRDSLVLLQIELKPYESVLYTF